MNTGGTPPIRQTLAQALCTALLPGRITPNEHLPSQISPVSRQLPRGSRTGGEASPGAACS